MAKVSSNHMSGVGIPEQVGDWLETVPLEHLDVAEEAVRRTLLAMAGRRPATTEAATAAKQRYAADAQKLIAHVGEIVKARAILQDKPIESDRQFVLRVRDFICKHVESGRSFGLDDCFYMDPGLPVPSESTVRRALKAHLMIS